MSSEKLAELAACKCGGSFSWHWNPSKKKSGFSNAAVKCDKCGTKLDAKEAHEFTQAILKQVK